MRANIFRRNEFYLLMVIVVFSLAITIVNPAFFTIENMFDLIRSSAGMAILAVGFFVVLLSGGIDISFPAVAIVAQYITVNAGLAHAVFLEAHLARAFHQGQRSRHHGMLGQPPPVDRSDLPRPRRQRVRLLPRRRVLEHEDRRARQPHDHFGRIAADEGDRAVGGGVLPHRLRQMRVDEGDELFEAFRPAHGFVPYRAIIPPS